MNRRERTEEFQSPSRPFAIEVARGCLPPRAVAAVGPSLDSSTLSNPISSIFPWFGQRRTPYHPLPRRSRRSAILHARRWLLR
jgi:hypothetical protein